MSNVALECHAGAVAGFVEDHLHRIKLIHNKPRVLKPSKCTRFDIFPANYGFKGGIMSLEKLPILFLLDVSTVIPYKTLAPYAKPIATPIDVAMPVLPPDAYHYQGTKQFLPEAFEGPLELGCPIVYGHGGTETLSLAENIHLETKKAGWSEADFMAEVDTQKVGAVGATELLVNVLSQTGKAKAQFTSKSSIDYEMIVLQLVEDNTKGESISPTFYPAILPVSKLKDADQNAHPYENPDNDDADCSGCGYCSIM